MSQLSISASFQSRKIMFDINSSIYSPSWIQHYRTPFCNQRPQNKRFLINNFFVERANITHNLLRFWRKFIVHHHLKLAYASIPNLNFQISIKNVITYLEIFQFQILKWISSKIATLVCHLGYDFNFKNKFKETQFLRK